MSSDQNNGSLPFPSSQSPLTLSPTMSLPKRPRSTTPPSLDNLEHTKVRCTSSEAHTPCSTVVSSNSAPSKPPIYNPAALLNPRGMTATATRRPHVQLTTNKKGDEATDDDVVFQFSTTSNGWSSDAIAQNGPVEHEERDAPIANGNGMGALLDRKFNLQERSSIPEPKRRRIHDDSDDASDHKNTFRTAGGSGILGDHLNQERANGKSVPSLSRQVTVDLTEGMLIPIFAVLIGS